jgi:hypothetical protein
VAGVGLPRLAAVDVGVWTRLQRHASARSEKRRTTTRRPQTRGAQVRGGGTYPPALIVATLNVSAGVVAVALAVVAVTYMRAR